MNAGPYLFNRGAIPRIVGCELAIGKLFPVAGLGGGPPDGLPFNIWMFVHPNPPVLERRGTCHPCPPSHKAAHA